MAELVWKGKFRNDAPGKAPRTAPPLRTDEVHGGDLSQDAWRNRLVHGDQSVVLPTWLNEFAGRVALAYIDPPFDTGGAFAFQASIPGTPEDTPRIAVRAYDDARGLDRWLQWFFEAALRLCELLSEGGSLYVHLDAHVAHYAKVVLDEVFGPGSFQREIVWRIGWVSGFKSRAKNWIRNHDVILFYAKGGRRGGRKGKGTAGKGESGYVFNKEYIAYPKGYVRRDGTPPRGPGYPIEDVWNGSDLDRLDSIQIVSFSKEKVGYPTQKNEKLLSRIVRASSNPGDLVVDCFAGSGTTAVVAEKLGRRWLACDVAAIAIHATRKRLLASPEAKPFVVQAAGSGEAVPKRRLTARLGVSGLTATIELVSFAMPRSHLPSASRRGVQHWSQWLEGWYVDWDHRGDALCVGSRQWRGGRASALPLSATHAYDRSGRYVALVRAFDVLGGATTSAFDVQVAD